MSEKSIEYEPVGLLKRLAAIFYDLLLLTALLFVVGIILASFATFMINDGNAITASHPLYPVYRILILSALLTTAYIFLGWFWVHGGQTLGMKTWKIQIKTVSGDNLTWHRAAIRFVAAIISWTFLGLGFLWALVDDKKRTWHDILSSTVLIKLEKKS